MSHTQQHTDSTKLPVPGWERTYNALVSTPLSQHSKSLCQPVTKVTGRYCNSVTCNYSYCPPMICGNITSITVRQR